MNKEYIYIGQYFHYHGKDLQDLGITEKKIGKTGDLKQREIQLNRTKGTIGYTYAAAWEVSDMNIVETLLHTAFDDNRLSGEWFDDVNDDLIERVGKIITLAKLGVEVDLGLSKDNKVNEVRHNAKSTVLIITWNDKIYQDNSSHKTLGKWAEDFILNPELTEDQLLSTYLFRKEPQLNPTTGLNYTTELSNNWWVMHNISNRRKAKSIMNIARDFKLNLKAEYN